MLIAQGLNLTTEQTPAVAIISGNDYDTNLSGICEWSVYNFIINETNVNNNYMVPSGS